VMRKGSDGGKWVLVLAVPTAPSDHLLHYWVLTMHINSNNWLVFLPFAYIN
jgi:hypothetical protein